MLYLNMKEKYHSQTGNAQIDRQAYGSDGGGKGQHRQVNHSGNTRVSGVLGSGGL